MRSLLRNRFFRNAAPLQAGAILTGCGGLATAVLLAHRCRRCQPVADDGAKCLHQAAIGQPLRLICVHGGRLLNHRLAELGLTPGTTLRVVQDSGGPLLLAVRDSRLALGRGMARKVEVTACEVCRS